MRAPAVNLASLPAWLTVPLCVAVAIVERIAFTKPRACPRPADGPASDYARRLSGGVA